MGRESEMRCSLKSHFRPIFTWTENRGNYQSPINPTVKQRIDAKIAFRQTTAHQGDKADFLKGEDNSRDPTIENMGCPHRSECRLCEKCYKERNMKVPTPSKVLEMSNAAALHFNSHA